MSQYARDVSQPSQSLGAFFQTTLRAVRLSVRSKTCVLFYANELLKSSASCPSTWMTEMVDGLRENSVNHEVLIVFVTEFSKAGQCHDY
jgi:hypothetical protein